MKKIFSKMTIMAMIFALLSVLSCKKDEKEVIYKIPTVVTGEISGITDTTAVCSGEVTDTGGAEVTSRGICWSENQNPTISDYCKKEGGGTGVFTSIITELVKGTRYYVRAYATNEAGTAYGEEKSFCIGHEYVDLGLPSGLMWARCNVGANNPEDYGDYYAWGETMTKSSFYKENCDTWGLEINSINGVALYDVAAANWIDAVNWIDGTSIDSVEWYIPTKIDFDELLANCQLEWTNQAGHNGYNVIGPNGNSIFLPAAGYRSGISLNNLDEDSGYYWSSLPNGTENAFNLFFYVDEVVVNDLPRYVGRSIRPVFKMTME